jgi:hypothetical protein
MIIGEIFCIKTTGEKVYILDLFTRSFQDTMRSFVTVRRPNVADGGGIIHETLDLFVDELESVDDHAERQIQEMLLKQKASKRFEELVTTQEAKSETQAAPKVN